MGKIVGPGFAFSGAGGRLAQHLALMEVLIKGLQPDGIVVSFTKWKQLKLGRLSSRKTSWKY